MGSTYHPHSISIEVQSTAVQRRHTRTCVSRLGTMEKDAPRLSDVIKSIKLMVRTESKIFLPRLG